MGWLWSSPSPPPQQTPQSQQQPPSQPPSSQTPVDPPKKVNDDDAALTEFLVELRSGLAKTDTPAKSQQSPSAESQSQSTPASSATSTLSSWLGSLASSAKASKSVEPEDLPASTSRNNPSPAADALAHSLRPTSMSCRQAFDLAYACQSMGGQFRAVYREGSVRSCSHLWDDFWFCMRIKSYTGPVKDEMVREHYRKKDLLKYGGKPNSEDVWISREEKVEPGSVFREPYVEENLSDEQWQLMEIARRKEIRKELGYE